MKFRAQFESCSTPLENTCAARSANALFFFDCISFFLSIPNALVHRLFCASSHSHAEQEALLPSFLAFFPLICACDPRLHSQGLSGVFQLLLSHMYRTLSKKLKVVPGAEFMAAFEALKVPRCCFVSCVLRCVCCPPRLFPFHLGSALCLLHTHTHTLLAIRSLSLSSLSMRPSCHLTITVRPLWV